MLRECLVLTELPSKTYYRFVADRLTVQRMIHRAAILGPEYDSFPGFEYPEVEEELD
jgi:hypothetical protein